jgi:YVTN family beta-propeller protein
VACQAASVPEAPHRWTSRVPNGGRAFGSPRGVSIAPDGRTAFVTLGGESSVAVVDPVGRKVVQRVTVGASPDGVASAPRPAR